MSKVAKKKSYDEDFKKMIVELYENKKPVVEIKRLKKELAQAKEENEILKKAVAIFTQK